jgi:hypothetical protein
MARAHAAIRRPEEGTLMRMTVAVALLPLLLLVGDAARAEPRELDERGLGAVAAGTADLLGPVNVAIGVSAPTGVVVTPSTEVAASVGVDVANQVGTGVAVNATTALGALASGVAAAGSSAVGTNLGLP